MTYNEYQELLVNSLDELANTQGTEDYETAKADYLDIFRIGARHGFSSLNNEMPDDYIMGAIEAGDTKNAIRALSDMKGMLDILKEEKSEFVSYWQRTYNELYEKLSV